VAEKIVETRDAIEVTPEAWLQTYVDEYRQLPIPEHLTKFAKNRGGTLSYSQAKTVIQRTKRLDPDANFLDALNNAMSKLQHMPNQVPVPLSTPRGARGLFASEGEYEDYEPMDLNSLPRSSVLLNVYDVEDDLVQRINWWGTMNDNVLIGGVFHVAVQSYGQEWSFGETEIEGISFSGIYSCPPRYNSYHKYKCTIDLGPTEMTEDEVHNLTQSMRCSNEWQGFAYDRLHHNCLHFANVFCNALDVGSLPGWLDRFGRAAEQVENLAEHWSQAKEMARNNLQSAREHVAKSAPEIGARVARWSSGFLKAAMHSLGDGAGLVKEALKVEDDDDDEEAVKDIL
jgi:hypothetical protein